MASYHKSNIISCGAGFVGATGTPKPKVIVTGSGGLLGRILVNVLRDHYDVVGIDRFAMGRENEMVVDIAEKEDTVQAIKDIRPRVVIHTAAETDVDRCETERDHAWKVNVAATANVLEGCSKIEAKLILVSTDYVFDGEKGDYQETDQPNPVNYYGVTKLEAERIALTLTDSLVVRTSVLYGWHPAKLNFVTWTLKGLRERRSVRVVTDHINSPTLANNLAKGISAAVERDSQGVLHIAGSERISRFDFALKIARTFGLDQTLLIPVRMQDLSWTAKRPRDSSLRIENAEKELGIEFLGVDGGLEEMVKSQS